MRHFVTQLVFGILAATSGSAEDVRQGESIYLRYCATCHGLEATGHGPMRPVLTVQPADLTRLSSENEGTFPLFRVVKRIDGRDPLVAHGNPMPVYGSFFEERNSSLKTETGQRVQTSEPVADLVTYIKSLQVE